MSNLLTPEALAARRWVDRALGTHGFVALPLIRQEQDRHRDEKHAEADRSTWWARRMTIAEWLVEHYGDAERGVTFVLGAHADDLGPNWEEIERYEAVHFASDAEREAAEQLGFDGEVTEVVSVGRDYHMIDTYGSEQTTLLEDLFGFLGTAPAWREADPPDGLPSGAAGFLQLISRLRDAETERAATCRRLATEAAERVDALDDKLRDPIGMLQTEEAPKPEAAATDAVDPEERENECLDLDTLDVDRLQKEREYLVYVVTEMLYQKRASTLPMAHQQLRMRLEQGHTLACGTPKSLRDALGRTYGTGVADAKLLGYKSLKRDVQEQLGLNR